MPNLVVLRPMEEVIALMASYMGTRWPNPWASYYGNNPSIDDCAMCVSWALFGNQWNGMPYNTVVSGVIERSGQQFVAGNQGIRRGDAIGFRWSTDVNYHHIELALNSPDWLGRFQTIGTNAGPNDDMAVRWRTINYVHNFARPNYPSSPAGGANPEELDMGAVEEIKDAIRREGNGRIIFDSGPSGAVAFDKTNRAAVVDHKVRILPADPIDRKAMIDETRADNDGLFFAMAENPDGFITTAYNWQLEWEMPLASDGLPFSVPGLGRFVENTIELEAGPTWQVYSEGGRYEYTNRQDVWRDGRPVKVTKGGKLVVGFLTKNGAPFAKLEGVTQPVALTPTEASRADAQRASKQRWTAI